MQVGNAYVIVYSITDRSSFESASELRIQLRRIRQAEDIPIILVGNKSDLVRCREVAVEGEGKPRGMQWEMDEFLKEAQHVTLYYLFQLFQIELILNSNKTFKYAKKLC